MELHPTGAWRRQSGMPERPDEVGDQFWLVGPDGTRVLAVHLRNTYCNAHAVGAAPGAFGPPLFRVGPYGEHTQTSEYLHRAARRTDVRKGVADIVAAARKAEPGCHTGVIPIANGYDSAVPQEPIGQIIDRANQEQDEYELVHGDCAELVQTMLGRGARFQYLLPGAITTRSYLKQANSACEALLERYAEHLRVRLVRGAPELGPPFDLSRGGGRAGAAPSTRPRTGSRPPICGSVPSPGPPTTTGGSCASGRTRGGRRRRASRWPRSSGRSPRSR